MNVYITVGAHVLAFTMDEEARRWHCLKELKEAAFPLVTVWDGKRYELYSDSTFAEVER